MQIAFDKLMPLFNFFFALETGTNSVERGLGRHAKHRQAHVGPAPTDIQWPAVCFEVHDDGPDSETAVAAKNSHGTLLFTDFSRRCAQLWVCTRGRRFCVNTAPRKNKGCTGTRWRLTGSMQDVRAAQRRALDTLGKASVLATDTIAKQRKNSIIGDARIAADKFTATKQLDNFKTKKLHKF